jgi:hypothetical protein
VERCGGGLVVGFLLLGSEVVTPRSLLFFGCGALCGGLLGLVGLSGSVWAPWLLLTILSPASG